MHLCASTSMSVTHASCASASIPQHQNQRSSVWGVPERERAIELAERRHWPKGGSIEIGANVCACSCQTSSDPPQKVTLNQRVTGGGLAPARRVTDGGSLLGHYRTTWPQCMVAPMYGGPVAPMCFLWLHVAHCKEVPPCAHYGLGCFFCNAQSTSRHHTYMAI